MDHEIEILWRNENKQKVEIMYKKIVSALWCFFIMGGYISSIVYTMHDRHAGSNALY